MTDSWTLAQARASWWHKQALAGTSKRPLAALIGESGWLRTLGGADAYLAARARRPGMKRAELDAAIAAGELRVHPAVRGCIYLVPAAVVPGCSRSTRWTTSRLAPTGWPGSPARSRPRRAAPRPPGRRRGRPASRLRSARSAGGPASRVA